MKRPDKKTSKSAFKTLQQKQEYERELEMERFRNHYLVATKNLNRENEIKDCNTLTSLWTSGQHQKLYDESDFGKGILIQKKRKDI